MYETDRHSLGDQGGLRVGGILYTSMSYQLILLAYYTRIMCVCIINI